jgi:hypothetical protein
MKGWPVGARPVWNGVLAVVCAVFCGNGCSGAAFNVGDAAAEGSAGSSSGSGGSSGSSGGSSSSSGSTSSSGASDTGSGSGPCTTDADCATGERCGFAESAGCTATGSCFPAPGVTCNVVLLACACDGTDINVACNGLPGDYAPKPYAHSGACGLDSGGGGKDAGTLVCGPYSCDVATEFCYEAGGGAVLPDAGSNFTYACNPIPTQCRPNPTCACIIAADAGTHGCPCSVEPGGALLAACLYP